jgi:hypothetical protein
MVTWCHTNQPNSSISINLHGYILTDGKCPATPDSITLPAISQAIFEGNFSLGATHRRNQHVNDPERIVREIGGSGRDFGG